MVSFFKFCGCRAFFEATGKASIVSFPDRGRSTGWSVYGRSHCVADVSLLVLNIYTLYYVYIAILKLYW